MKGFRKISGGASIGARAKIAYVCSACLERYLFQPAQCRCGHLEFDRFDSQAEVKRWGELRMQEKIGEISKLRRQVSYTLHAYNHGLKAAARVGRYVADFHYIDKFGDEVCEDVKGGAITDIFDWKRRHMLAEYGIKIQMIKR